MRNFVIGFFCISLSLCLTAPTSALAQKKGGAPAAPPAPVEVSAAIEKDVSAPIELVGTAHALTDSVISAEEDGRVVSFDNIEGDFVKKSDTVVLLDETPYKLNARAARGTLEKAKVALARARLAEERVKELYIEEVASEEARQNAELETRAAVAEVMLRQAQLEQAEYELSRCKVKAPFSGYISRKIVDVGEWVKKGDGLFEVIDIHKVDIVVEAPERFIADLAKGKKASVKLDAYPGRTFEGSIKVVFPKADIKTRTFMVKIEVGNKDGMIKAGMVSRVSVASGKGKKAVLIPRDAVVRRARKSVVFTIGEDGAARMITVTLGRQYGESVEVKEGIHAGDILIVTGNEILRDGQPVRVVGEKSFH